MDECETQRYYLVFLNENKIAKKNQGQNCIAVFSTYELAMNYCRSIDIPLEAITGLPINDGYIDLNTKKCYNLFF